MKIKNLTDKLITLNTNKKDETIKLLPSAEAVTVSENVVKNTFVKLLVKAGHVKVYQSSKNKNVITDESVEK